MSFDSRAERSDQAMITSTTTAKARLAIAAIAICFRGSELSRPPTLLGGSTTLRTVLSSCPTAALVSLVSSSFCCNPETARVSPSTLRMSWSN